jgi:hypothetical protein
MATDGRCCRACGTSATALECNEEWSYDDDRLVASLARFGLLFKPCHTAAHIGRAGKHGLRVIALAQLCKVNGISIDRAKLMEKEATEVQRARGEKKWVLENRAGSYETVSPARYSSHQGLKYVRPTN